MKLLLSCVNSLVSFIGFDLLKGESFWYCPSDRLRTCGAGYDHINRALLSATDNTLTRLHASGRVEHILLPGPHENLLHSVHVLPGMGIGVADTGNSRILVYGDDLQAAVQFSPLPGWGDIPLDTLHLNDFVLTPHGLVASCFNYQPFRVMQIEGYQWQKRGYGLLLSLEKFKGHNVGRILAAGLECPHSLIWHNESLYCCASATGEFVRFTFNERGMLVERERIFITDKHFLRGALPLEDGSWMLGGSSLRRKQDEGMALYRLEAEGKITKLPVASAGEIYDILPWEPAIMSPVSAIMSGLPPIFADPESEYPPPCSLESCYR